MGFSLKLTTTLAIVVIHKKSFMKLSKTFLNYAANVFVQRKHYEHGDGAYLRGCLNNKAVRNSVIGKLITEFRYVLLEIY